MDRGAAAGVEKAYCHFMYKTGEDEYQSLAEFNDMPIDQFPLVRTVDVSNYMNHSCDPTCVFVQGGDEYTGLMVAARDLMPGDEITYDYCTSEDCELSPAWDCHCRQPNCRGRITPYDWQLPALQKRYASHFLPHIAAKITEAASDASAAAAATPVLQPCDAGARSPPSPAPSPAPPDPARMPRRVWRRSGVARAALTVGGARTKKGAPVAVEGRGPQAAARAPAAAL